jgi:Flp pilus assembly pilin Flp
MALMLSKLRMNQLWRDQKGQDVVEYALISGLVASTVIAVVPPMVSIAMQIVELLNKVAEIAMNAAGLG